MVTDYIDHEEATIQSYMRDPEFADYMLNEAINDGDITAIRKIQRRINEAKARKELEEAGFSYWGSLVDNAEKTAENGKNLDLIISLVNTALEILKSATTKKAVTA